MINVQNVKELKELLTLENLKDKRYIHLTVGYDDMNYLEVYLSKFNNETKKLVCCDVICDDEIINYYYYYTVEELVKQISTDWELE
jgi:uncharacterized radical SAM superfamily protein